MRSNRIHMPQWLGEAIYFMMAFSLEMSLKYMRTYRKHKLKRRSSNIFYLKMMFNAKYVFFLEAG